MQCVFNTLHIFYPLYVCIYYVCKIRNWPTWLWRLISPKICSQQDRNPEEPMCSSGPSPKAWKPRVIMVQVPIWKPAGSRPKKSQCFHLNPKARKDQMSQLSQAGVPSYSAFLFCSGLHLIRWGPSTVRRAVCFTQSTDSNTNLTQKHPHRLTQNNVWAPCDPVTLTHKINHQMVLYIYLWVWSPNKRISKQNF